MNATIPTALAALLLTGCSGTLWGLHGIHADDTATDHFRGATQMVAPAAMAQPVAPTPPADVPNPAAVPVVLVAWLWAQRLRNRTASRSRQPHNKQ